MHSGWIFTGDLFQSWENSNSLTHLIEDSKEMFPDQSNPENQSRSKVLVSGMRALITAVVRTKMKNAPKGTNGYPYGSEK